MDMMVVMRVLPKSVIRLKDMLYAKSGEKIDARPVVATHYLVMMKLKMKLMMKLMNGCESEDSIEEILINEIVDDAQQSTAQVY